MMRTITERNGVEATSTELLRMEHNSVPLDRVVDFWRNPVEKTLYVMLDHMTDGELVQCLDNPLFKRIV